MSKTLLKNSIVVITALFMLFIFTNVVNAVNNANEKITYFTGTIDNGGPGTNLLNASTGDTFTDTVKLKDIASFDANSQIVAIKNAGYEFNGWKLVDNSSNGVLAQGEPSRITSDTSKAIYTIMGEEGWLNGTNPVVGGFAVVAQWKLKVYDVTVNSGVENGTIEASAEKVNHGDSCEITVTPNTGYEISSLVIEMDGTELSEGTGYSKNENVYTIDEVTGDIDATVTFSKISFNVSTSVKGGNGTITEGTSVEYDDNFVITLTPNLGYMLDYLKVDSVEVDVTGNTYTLSNVKAEHVVEASYKKIPFTLNIVGMDGATVEDTGTFTVYYGDTKIIPIKENKGYNLVSVTVNGEEVELSDDTLELKNISKNTEVIVTVEKETYTVIEGNQQILTEGEKDLVVKFDGDLDLFVKLYLNEDEVDSKYYKLESGSTIVTLDKEYIATLKEGTYTLTAEYANGNRADATFTIEEKVDVPQTGDTIVYAIIIATIAVVGLVITTRKYKLAK